MTAGKPHNPEHDNNFDLVRLLAASQVMYSHAIEHLKLPHPEGLGLWITFTFPGVAVFFIISGFLVTQSFYNCKEQPSQFLSRRATRIYPGLFANLFFIAVLIIVCANFSPTLRNLITLPVWFLTSVLMGSDYYGNLLIGSPFNWDIGLLKMFPSGVLWSISAELGFYLLVPLAFSRALRERGWLVYSIAGWIIASFAVSALTTVYKDELPPVVQATLLCSPFPHFWIFLVGACFQRLWPVLRPYVVGKAFFWIPLYLGVSYVDMRYFNNSVLDYMKPTPMIALRVVLIAFAILSFAYTLPRMARVLGGADLSYGIYLWHMPFLNVLLLLKLTPSPGGWVIMVGGTATIAALSWFLLEKPAMARKGEVSRLLVGVSDMITHRGGQALARLPLGPVGPALRRVPLQLTTSVLALLCAFGLVLYVVDSGRSRQITGIERGPAVLALTPDTRGQWTAVGTARMEGDAAVTRVTGDLTQWGTQFYSVDIPAPPHGDFILDYEIETDNGKMGIGVLDARPNGRWITVVPQIQTAKGSVRFQSRGKPLRLALFNSNTVPSQTTATIRSLTLYPVR